jgi:general secretion pathway protein A
MLLPVFLCRVSSPVVPLIESSPAEKFFGLAARPFSLTPDLRFAYHSRSHTHALEQVTSALRRREGLIVVTGAVGTGKTMLCRSMLESFESRTFLSVILDPGLEVEDLLRKVLTDFGILDGVDAAASGPMTDVTRHQFVTTLQQFLASLIPLQAHAVIMIDEAQRLNPRVLEEIRLLSNFETDEAKLLQIVLVGQPELDEMLRHPRMQQLNQRVARRCELQPLSETEVGDYIERRLAVASSPAALSGIDDTTPAADGGSVRFLPAAVKTVAAVSAGIPRLVNTVCDRTLDVAYERKIRAIDPEAVLTAAERLRIERPEDVALPATRRIPTLAMTAAVLLLLVTGVWWWTRTPAPDTRAVQPSAATPGPAPAARAPQRPDAAVDSPAPAESTPRAAVPSGAPPAAASPTASSRPAASPAATAGVSNAAASNGFQIAVAAFRTESRAQAVRSAIADLQVPATVRLDATGTWYRVLAGPFNTREAAVAAQDALSRNGYTDTLISAPVSDGR